MAGKLQYDCAKHHLSFLQAREHYDMMAQLAKIHAWSYFQWSALAIGLFLWLLYILFTGPYRRLLGAANEAPPTALQHVYMALGQMLYLFAFFSPLDHISDDYLFSAHMVQHMVEVSVMVPLLLKALPNWLWSWAFQWQPFKRMFSFMTKPVVALVVFFLVFDDFHWPVLYDLTLVNSPFHVFEHLMFFFTAVFLWWPILSTHPELPRLTPGWRLVYLFFAFDTMMPPSILLLSWNTPLYVPYTHAPLRLFGLSPVTDQKLGAVIMFLFGVVSELPPAIAAFAQFDFGQWYE